MRQLQVLLIVLALAVVVRRWAWMPLLITGDSMLPTLHDGQLAACNKLIYLVQEPRRGDVVAVWTGRELLIKRVLGLPGEEIEVREGVIFVNGKRVTEKYPHAEDRSTIAPGRLGPDTFVVAGDNRPRSLIAVVKRDRIVGRLSTRTD